MTDIAPIGPTGAPSLDRAAAPTRPAATPTAAPTRGDDRVEFSQLSQLLSRLQDLPDVRPDLVARVRAEIDAGTYETPDKLDAAIAELVEDLG